VSSGGCPLAACANLSWRCSRRWASWWPAPGLERATPGRRVDERSRGAQPRQDPARAIAGCESTARASDGMRRNESGRRRGGRARLPRPRCSSSTAWRRNELTSSRE
jgi:hypothetical protein